MAKERITYQCTQCDYRSSTLLGRCPDCGKWDTLVEHRTIKASPLQQREVKRESVAHASGHRVEPLPLSSVVMTHTERYTSGYPEMDRVLGSGVVPGSYVLIGGDPGIGKSTLMLQMAHQVSIAGKTVLYVAGEESPFQIRLRADRLDVCGDGIVVFPETDIQQVIEQIQTLKPDLVIIDSIQSMYSTGLSGTPGSVGQIKECAGMLMSVAKAFGVTIFLVGHVTKEGAVSGPKLLEHTVDAVLYFEGEKYQNLRILRSVKNRFGNTQEIGVFEIGERGLQEVANPSELFLSESSYQNAPGSVIVSTMEGSRPLLVELQALVGQSTYPTPRRVATGVEHNRLHQIVAVLERRLGLDFSHQDIYVNVVGGLRIDEPAADLGIAMAIVTSQRNISVRFGTVLAGEIGLTGEIRPIRQGDARIGEARKIGFHRIILPQGAYTSTEGAIEVTCVRTFMDALRECLAPADPYPSTEEVEQTHQATDVPPLWRR
jgi:DNA repair protein RadA/Sms